MTNEWVKQEAQDMWLPEQAGDELVGTVTDVTEGLYGKQHTIKKDDGTLIKTPSHKVLQNRLVECVAGDVVKIVFSGEQPPAVRGNNPTKIYEVFKKGGQ